MRELAVLKHFQHENLLQYVGASNAESVEPGGEETEGKIVGFCIFWVVIR